MGIIMWFLNLGWKILGIIAGFMLLSYILGQGVDGIRDVLATIGLAIRAMGHAIRKKLISYLRKESAEEGEPEKPEETPKEPEEDNTEAKDNENPAIVYMSYEDLKRVLKNGESSTTP